MKNSEYKYLKIQFKVHRETPNCEPVEFISYKFESNQETIFIKLIKSTHQTVKNILTSKTKEPLGTLYLLYNCIF